MLSSARKSVWKVGTRRVARPALSRVLDYYKFNAVNKRNLLSAYNKYINALNNTNPKNAHAHAKAASIKFVNTMFKIYEKVGHHKPGPVANGIYNGVHKSLVWWLPGVMYRKAIGVRPKARSAPVVRQKLASASPVKPRRSR
jgi:hypothetical protein